MFGEFIIDLVLIHISIVFILDDINYILKR